MTIRQANPFADFVSRLKGAAIEELFGGPVHMSLLTGPVPERINLAPIDPFPASTIRGQAIGKRQWQFASGTLDVPEGRYPWTQASPSRAFARSLHSFAWLRDLLVLGEDGAEHARRLIDAWVDSFGRFNLFAWAPDILSLRLLAFSHHLANLYPDQDTARARKAFDSYARQYRHLGLIMPAGVDVADQLSASAALLVAGIVLQDEPKRVQLARQFVRASLEAALLSDGTPSDRSPETLIGLCYEMAVIRSALALAEQPALPEIDAALERALGMLSFFTLGDGALPSFHGGGASTKAIVQAAQALGPAPTRKFSFASHGGYQRLDAGALTLIMDTGSAPAAAFAHEAHASALAFEASIGPQRVFVSCGVRASEDPAWRAASRLTAAHCALDLCDRPNADVETGKPGKRPPPLLGPPGVTVRRSEEELGLWIDARHEGYRASFGLIHRRRLFVTPDGTDLRGEDQILRPHTEARVDALRPTPFVVRFHLHPDVQVKLAEDNHGAVLDLGVTGRWRFRTDHKIDLQPSVYFGEGAPRRTHQLSLMSHADPNGDGTQSTNRILWRMTPLES